MKKRLFIYLKMKLQQTFSTKVKSAVYVCSLHMYHTHTEFTLEIIDIYDETFSFIISLFEFTANNNNEKHVSVKFLCGKTLTTIRTKIYE